MQKKKDEIDALILKKPHHHAKAHGGAWKVAYADLVTAMMALFIVLWVLSQDQAVVKAVGGYFKDPHQKTGKNDRGPATAPGGTRDPGKLDDPQLQKIQKERLQEMAQKIVHDLSRSPEFKDLMDQIKIEIVPEGMRIEIVESSKDVFFEIGTSNLKPQMVHMLEKIGAQLTQLPNRVIVEGHTDSRPYTGSLYQTNFELSADRANAARRALAGGGMQEKQIEEIRGCSDSHLRDQADPLNVVNRRISILVKYNSVDASSGGTPE